MKLKMRHNPYFNRWFSAILHLMLHILIYMCHNPYFNRWFSAIRKGSDFDGKCGVTILILIDGFLQFSRLHIAEKSLQKSQSLF